MRDVNVIGGPATMETPMHCDVCEAAPPEIGALAVGMYELDSSGRRHGRVRRMVGLLLLWGTASGTYQRKTVLQIEMVKMHDEDELKTLQCTAALECSGVFDIKWRPMKKSCSGETRIDGTRNSALAVCALADGSCQLLRCNLDIIEIVGVAEEAACGGMTLYCGWELNNASVLCSSSSGHATLCRLRESGIVIESSWQAHNSEVWMISCDCHMEHTIFTGADDSQFKGWDARDTTTPAFVLRKHHSAGVCCIQSNPHKPFQVATGSYDECVRLWDLRNMVRPINTSQIRTGGGVWRLKWHPELPDVALLACMQHGFVVAHFSNEKSSQDVLLNYPEQKVLAYGADWWMQNGSWWAATGSFYDNSVNVWLPSLT